MIRLSSFIFATAFCATAAFAAGGAGTLAPVKPVMKSHSPMALHCKKGEMVKSKLVYGKSVKSCTKIKKAELEDRDLYEQGWQLAKAGEYDWAIEMFSAVQNQNDPDVLNMMGYSNRKAGRLDVGFSYYEKALAIRPDFARAREYLGEGLIAAGKVDQARLQLGEIQKICGTTCEEYIDLSAAIDKSGL